jgi:transcriptional regulator with XRE-family HTH domain
MSQMTHEAGIPQWTLGWRLQRSLSHANLTSEAMASELGVVRSTISRWMNDRGAPPRAGYLKAWALRCGVPYLWLATGQEGAPDSGPGLGVEPTAEYGRVLPFGARRSSDAEIPTAEAA